MGVTFHGICPPTFIQTWLQQYSRGAFLYSAHCSFCNLISLWSMWCRRAMIPGEIFTGFAEFQEIVSFYDFRLPIGLQELLQASLGFLWSFCFARIRLDPLTGQVLHHDCISVIVSIFTTFTENLVICCYQITKIFCTKYDSTNTSSARGPCDFGPLTDLAISVFREMSFNAMFAQISSRLLNVGSKDTSWEELACESLRSGTSSSTKFSWILAATPGFQNLRDLSQHTTGCAVLSSTLEIDTGTGEVSPSVRPSLSQVSLSLGKEDELEEDVELGLSCLEVSLKLND